LLIPLPIGQMSVMDVIYNGIKASNRNISLNQFYETIDELFEKGAEILVLGCTELPVAFELFHIERPSIDPTSVLAAAAIRFVEKPLLNRLTQ
jgi:aspartate racemase